MKKKSRKNYEKKIRWKTPEIFSGRTMSEIFSGRTISEIFTERTMSEIF